MTAPARVLPVTRAVARRAVADWHSHHKPHVGETLALGAFVGGGVVAVLHALAGSPTMLDARALDLAPAIPPRFRYLPHNRTRPVRYLVDVAISTTHTL